MSLKNDFKQVRQELSNDEKMLESVFRIEAFIKRNKIWLLGLVGVGIAMIAGYQIKDYLNEKKAMRVSALFAEMNQNGSSSEVLAKLEKESKELYELVILNEAIKNQNKEDLTKLQTSSNSFIASYAGYELASLTQSFDSQKNYNAFHPLVLLQEGYMLSSKGEHKKALDKLNEIELKSEFKEWALGIGHYGITK